MPRSGAEKRQCLLLIAAGMFHGQIQSRIISLIHLYPVPVSITAGLYSVQKEFSMSFLIYLVGFAILIGGVAWALITAGVPDLYVVIASVILLGIGILTGVSRTRAKDPS